MNRAHYPFFLIIYLSTFPHLAMDHVDHIEESGVQGGFICHVQSAAPDTSPLYAGHERYVIQTLYRDASAVGAARKMIATAGCYGPVTARHLDDNYLPYVDNMVNLIVLEDLCGLTLAEVLRVLVPGGVARIRSRQLTELTQMLREAEVQEFTLNGQWLQFRKKWPTEIDEWTHYFYDASGNPVSRDRRVGPPQHIQWEDHPKYDRSHDAVSSFHGSVSAGGRIYSILDKASYSTLYVPSRWTLVARDAFNGVLLWEKPLIEWFTQYYPEKQGPHQIFRRLVACGDRVYATLGLYEPVSEIDGATGKILRVFPGTDHATEFLQVKNKLIILVHTNKEKVHAQRFKQAPPPGYRGYTLPSHREEHLLKVIHIATGKTDWEERVHLSTLTLAAQEDCLIYHSGREVVCRDLRRGTELWRTPVTELTPKVDFRASPAVQWYKGNVYYGDHRQLVCLSGTDGRVLWRKEVFNTAFKSPSVLLILHDTIWVPSSHAWLSNTKGTGDSQPGGNIIGYDCHTGKVKRVLTADLEQNIGFMHHRCHIARAAGDNLLTGWPGVELMNTRTGKMAAHAWIRGACLFGYLPANGIIYCPPHPCACNIKGKLNGFNAVVPPRSLGASSVRKPIPPNRRLSKGPAYGQVPIKPIDIARAWPIHRHDSKRSGATPMALPATLAPKWETHLGGQLTQATIADGKAFVPSTNRHMVQMVDIKSGKVQWRYRAGGRIDSSPTYYKGLVIFGAHDGIVHCLDARNGRVVWRFNAARNGYQYLSFGQLKSPYAAHGSVLVADDKLYVNVGKSAHLEEGIFLYQLDPVSGKTFWENRIYLRDEKGRQPGIKGKFGFAGFEGPGVKDDLLSSDSEWLYLRHAAIDLDGCYHDGKGNQHLYSMTGFLDPDWFDRAGWAYNTDRIMIRAIGKDRDPGSKIMVFDSKNIYYWGLNSISLRTYDYWDRFFLAGAPLNKVNPQKGAKLKKKYKPGEKKRLTPNRYMEIWKNEYRHHVRTMLLAGDHLFVAGDRGDWVTSQAALEGKEGAFLDTFSTKTGRLLSSVVLPDTPVWDGMSAAEDCLLISLRNGNLLCLTQRSQPGLKNGK
jgi:outer membrane protein assembly factor BamB